MENPKTEPEGGREGRRRARPRRVSGFPRCPGAADQAFGEPPEEETAGLWKAGASKRCPEKSGARRCPGT